MNSNKSLIIIAVFILALFSTTKAQNSLGAICISDEGVSAHESAILQIKSEKKGVLFPRMSYEAALNIENKKNGLIVFITDENKLGYWYWLAQEGKWKQVRNEETDGQDIEAPTGGIIMYSGPIDALLFSSNGCGYKGTIMNGWQICNGLNGSPNLIGQFVMGNITGANEHGGADSIKLIPANMPEHTHKANTISGFISAHDHTIDEQVHLHSVNVMWKRIRGARRKRHFERRNNGPSVVRYLEESLDAGISGNLKMSDKSGQITFRTDELNKEIKVSETGGGEAIDNRPSFYVLVYLMRTGGDGCEK